MVQAKRRQIIGWAAVALSTLIACFWAMWGIIENFHEGWFYGSILANLGLMLVQYLSPVIIFVGLSAVSIQLPRAGGMAHLMLGVFIPLALKQINFTFLVFIVAPLVLLGTLYWFGRPRPHKAAFAVIVLSPLLTLIVSGVGPALRVAARNDDADLRARVVAGNGVTLIWAPEGPGWPREGTTWYEAVNRCQHLSEDGQSLSQTAQSIWRLPTVEEVVRSMSLHGQNSGGTWNQENRTASYRTSADKESPLWNVHSQVIYWWTATEIDDQTAYIIVYDGKVWPRRKQIHPAYLGYRCVKTP